MAIDNIESSVALYGRAYVYDGVLLDPSKLIVHTTVQSPPPFEIIRLKEEECKQLADDVRLLIKLRTSTMINPSQEKRLAELMEIYA